MGEVTRAVVGTVSVLARGANALIAGVGKSGNADVEESETMEEDVEVLKH